MQNLRDKLLKAGLVTEKQAQEAAKEQRQGSAGKHREREKQISEEERQRREAFAARETELADERRKEAAKQAEARMQAPRAGEISFHYVRRSGKIGRLD